MIKIIASPFFLTLSYAVFFYFFGVKGLLWIIISCICLGLLVFFKQDKLVYMPAVPTMPQFPSDNSYGLRHPRQMGFQSHDIQIVTQDNIKLKGWYIENGEQVDRLIVYFQDNAGNIGLKLPFLKNLILRTRSNVIIVAYRGYSESQGIPSQKGLKADARAIINYSINKKEQQKFRRLFVYGRSLGGAVSIDVCANPDYQGKIDGIILQNTFTSISDLLDTLAPILKYFKSLQKNHWRSIDLIGKLQTPIYFIKSVRDEIVDVSHMDRLQKNAISSKLIDQLRIMTGTHNSSWHQNPDQFFIHLLTFFERVQSLYKQ